VPKRLRVVLDTSVLVAALGFRGEVTGRIWHLAEDEDFDLFVSAFILEEFRRVLLKKTDIGPEGVGLLAEDIRLASALVEPKVKISAITKDDTDNRILECAVEAEADVLVTGNLKHIKPLGYFQGIEILTPREFLDKYFPGI